MTAAKTYRSALLSTICSCLLLFSGSGVGQEHAQVTIEQYENIPEDFVVARRFGERPADIRWQSPVLGTTLYPGKLSPAGRTMIRTQGYGVRIRGRITLPPGQHRIHLRTVNHARVFIDGQQTAVGTPPKPRELTAQEKAAKEAEDKAERERLAQEAAAKATLDQKRRLVELSELSKQQKQERFQAIQQEVAKIYEDGPPRKMPGPEFTVVSHGRPMEFVIEASGKSLTEVSLTYQSQEMETPRLLTMGDPVPYSKNGWKAWRKSEQETLRHTVETAAAPLRARWERKWQERADYWRGLRRPHAAVPGDLPPSVPIFNEVDRFLGVDLAKAGAKAAALTDDYEFVRRLYLDAWGLAPSWEQVEEFVADSRPNKRELLIDRLLADKRWADPWVSYWEDLLAENPNIQGEIPNASGPFKDWIYDSVANNRGLDRFATELLLMEGTHTERGTLGFREAALNDVPLAHKAHIVASAFMAAQMGCARCHDSPINDYEQRDLFGLAAILSGAPVEIPETSSAGAVPGRRKPLVQVTSFPGDKIEPRWVFVHSAESSEGRSLAGRSARELRLALADSMTSSHRYAKVVANRIWARFMGRGLVHPVDDWEIGGASSNPTLLEYLAKEFLWSGQSVRHVQELVLKSHAYQRRVDPELAQAEFEGRHLFAAQLQRRMSAEQLVDSLFLSVRRPMEKESERMAYGSKDYGYPERLWQVVTMSNEEDTELLGSSRHGLQGIVTLATAFGWREQRQDPLTYRLDEPNPLQPLALANGTTANRLFRLTNRSYYTELSHEDLSLTEFARRVFFNTLSRPPSAKERRWFVNYLEPVWKSRKAAKLHGKATSGDLSEKSILIPDHVLARKLAEEARQGEPLTETLTEDYSERLEDVLWVLHNSPQFQFLP